MRGTDTVNDIRSDIYEMYDGRKEKYNLRFGNYTKYISKDIKIQLGFILGIFSMILLVSGIYQLITLSSITQSLFMIVIGFLGIKFTDNLLRTTISQLF